MRPTEKPKTEGATPELLAELWTESDGDTRAIANRFGVSPRTVRRWVVGWGIDQPRPVLRYVDDLSPGVLEALRQGMPSTWASEGTSHSASSMADWAHDTMPNRSDELREWYQIWPSILNNPVMRALHDEFAPRTKVTQ